MKGKYIWLIVLILVLISFGAFLLLKFNSYPTIQSKPIACTEEAKICPDGSSVSRTGTDCQFAECPIPTYGWSFEQLNSTTTTPLSSVTLIIGSKKYPLGEYEGNCLEIFESKVADSNWPLLTGEETGAICFFAGAGTELGVFEENGKLVVKKGLFDEGDAETPGIRGNFKTVLNIGDN